MERDRILQDVHALSRQRAQLRQRLDEARLEEHHARRDVNHLLQQITQAKKTLQNLEEKGKLDLGEDSAPNLLWIPIGGLLLLNFALASHLAAKRCLKKGQEKLTEEENGLEMKKEGEELVE